MNARTYPRATEPDLPSFNDAIRAHVVSATGKDLFYTSWNGSAVVLEMPNFTNINNATVQAAVDAAPVATNALAAKRLIDEISPVDRAKELVHLDELNVVRGALNPAKAAISAADHFAAIKTKLDTIVLDRPVKQ